MGSIRQLSLYLAIGGICTFSACESPAVSHQTRSFKEHATIRVRSNEIYVKPNDSDTPSCPADPCHTLDWYIKNRSNLFHSDTTTVFLEGTHSLTTIVNVSNFHNIGMYGIQSVRISCDKDNAGFLFLKCSDVDIKHISIEFCGGGALSFQQAINITLSHVSVNYAKGYGLLIMNVFGQISIKESSFSNTTNTPQDKYSANAMLCFGTKCEKNPPRLLNNHATNVTVLSSQFVDGQKVSGLRIFVHNPNTSIVIDNVTFHSNSGGNLVLAVTYLGGKPYTGIIKILNSRIYRGQTKFGGGLYLKCDDNETLSNDYLYLVIILEVHNTEFRSNYGSITGGATYLTQLQGKGKNQIIRRVIFINCSFTENRGNGAVIEINKHRILVDRTSPVLNVSFENCGFHDNYLHNNVKGSIMNIKMSHIIMSNCNFTDNNGTTVSLHTSNLNFHNDIRFINNKADYGAALKVCEASTIFLHNHSNVHFVNNSALMGGAVFSEQTCVDTAPSCIFQPTLPKSVFIKDFNSSLALMFVNNSAKLAGDTIYGGSLDSCYTWANYSFRHGASGSYFNYPLIFKEIFNMSGQLGPSWISSNPRGLCFCDNNEKLPQKYHCHTNHPVVEVYPGEKFIISAVVVGQFNGTTVGKIEANLLNGNGTQLHHHETKQSQNNYCVNLNYSIMLSKKTLSKLTIVLNTTTEVEAANSNLSPFTINYSVILLPCPLGFQLNDSEDNGVHKCECGPLFQQYRVTNHHIIKCKITEKTIQIVMKEAIVWIGCSEWKNGTICEQLMISPDCDYYCFNENYEINLTTNATDNIMCNQNRGGILCGACNYGYSRVLGSTQDCRKCSNKMLFVLIPWSLFSGVLLVLVLSVLNITVTEGILNGPIFYATVLYADINILPNKSVKGVRPLKTFISWLNLYLGFEACAYDGMDGYQYIWLLFGYVFYLIVIQGFIIFLSRKFIFFTRLCGRNVLKVLATVLFLLHSQLLYACLITFRLATLNVSTSNNTITERYVWYYDGNVPYLGLKHAVLFALATLCMLITTFFMLSLLLTQCLNKWTDYRFLHWFCRLRPFYEAFTGPCHNNYQFWPGFLYIMRSALSTLTILISGYHPNTKQMKLFFTCAACTLVMLLACIFPHGVYKKWPLNVLEFSFLLNLCITSITLGTSQSDRVLLISIPLAMLTCIVIMLYHAYQQCKNTSGWKRLAKYTHKMYKPKYSTSTDMEEEQEPLLPQALPPVANFKDFREALLKD